MESASTLPPFSSHQRHTGGSVRYWSASHFTYNHVPSFAGTPRTKRKSWPPLSFHPIASATDARSANSRSNISSAGVGMLHALTLSGHEECVAILDMEADQGAISRRQ